MKKRAILLLLALCFLFQLAACGGPAVESPAPTPSATVTPAPVPDPTPTPSPVPSVEPTLEPTPVPTPVPTPDPSPAPTYPVLLASNQLTGALLWQDGEDSFRLEKGEKTGAIPVDLPGSWVRIALVDAAREDADVSIHFLSEGTTTAVDLLWSEDAGGWISGREPDAPASLDLTAEPPLDDTAMAIAVPDFLTAEQQLLYRKAYQLHKLMFGGDTQWIDYFDADWTAYFPQSVDYGVYSYQLAAGRYRNWADFDALIHAVFTDTYWNGQNNGWAVDDGTVYRTYMEYDGLLAIMPAGRGGGWYNENFADKFRLVSKTEDSIQFIVTGHYSFPYFLEGESKEERDHRMETTYDFILEFPIRMVLTEDGWRFDEYSCPQTDDWKDDLTGLLGGN